MDTLEKFEKLISQLWNNCCMYHEKERWFVVGGDDWSIEIHEDDIDEINSELQMPKKVKFLIEGIKQMRLDTINCKNKEIITPMGKSYCNARIQAFTDVLEIIGGIYGKSNSGQEESDC